MGPCVVGQERGLLCPSLGGPDYSLLSSKRSGFVGRVMGGLGSDCWFSPFSATGFWVAAGLSVRFRRGSCGGFSSFLRILILMVRRRCLRDLFLLPFLPFKGLLPIVRMFRERTHRVWDAVRGFLGGQCLRASGIQFLQRGPRHPRKCERRVQKREGELGPGATEGPAQSLSLQVSQGFSIVPLSFHAVRQVSWPRVCGTRLFSGVMGGAPDRDSKSLATRAQEVRGMRWGFGPSHMYVASSRERPDTLTSRVPGPEEGGVRKRTGGEEVSSFSKEAAVEKTLHRQYPPQSSRSGGVVVVVHLPAKDRTCSARSCTRPRSMDRGPVATILGSTCETMSHMLIPPPLIRAERAVGWDHHSLLGWC